MNRSLKLCILILFLTGAVRAGAGVFGSPVIKPSEINEKAGIITGARLVVTLDNLILGASFYSHNLLRIETNIQDELINDSPYLELTYFGPEIGFKLFEFDENHINLTIFGGTAYTSLFTHIRLDEQGDKYNPEYGEDWFYMLEPGLYYNGKLTSWLHYETGVSYRLPFQADYTPKDFEISFTDNDYKGISVNFALQFGMF